MGKLSEAHILKVDQYLDSMDIRLDPLKAELKDHILSDLENHMHSGENFESAWKKITSSIPQNHFKTIENETMEIIDKRFRLTKVFSALSLLILLCASLFKVLHLPLTSILLIASLTIMSLTLMTGIFTGIQLYKEKTGKWLAIGIVTGLILFFISWVLEGFQLEAGNYLRYLTIILLSILVPIMTLRFSEMADPENNILVYIHKKQTPGIERFLLILLSFGLILKIAALNQAYAPNVALTLLLFVLLASGLHFFISHWQVARTFNKFWLGIIILSFISFFLPLALNTGILTFENRIFIGIFFFVSGLALAFKDYLSLYSIPVILLALFYIAGSMSHYLGMSKEMAAYVYSLPVFILLVASLVLFRKETLPRIYLIILLTHFIYFYPETS